MLQESSTAVPGYGHWTGVKQKTGLDPEKTPGFAPDWGVSTPTDWTDRTVRPEGVFARRLGGVENSWKNLICTEV